MGAHPSNKVCHCSINSPQVHFWSLSKWPHSDHLNFINEKYLLLINDENLKACMHDYTTAKKNSM